MLFYSVCRLSRVKIQQSINRREIYPISTLLCVWCRVEFSDAGRRHVIILTTLEKPAITTKQWVFLLATTHVVLRMFHQHREFSIWVPRWVLSDSLIFCVNIVLKKSATNAYVKTDAIHTLKYVIHLVRSGTLVYS